MKLNWVKKLTTKERFNGTTIDLKRKKAGFTAGFFLIITTLQQKIPIHPDRDFRFAESEGFEPPEACTSTVFKTAAFDHSANSP